MINPNALSRQMPASAVSPIGLRTRLTYVTIGLMMVLSLLTGLFNQTILSMGMVVCCLYLLYADRLVLAFPFIMFYNEFYGLVFGLSVLRIFTMMLLLNVLLRFRLDKKVKLSYFIPIGVYLFFLLTTMAPISSQRAVFAGVDVICCALMTAGLLEEDGHLQKFFEIYAFVAIASYITGMISGHTLEEGSVYDFEYSRFLGTFEDPNYMGFFFNVAIFSVMTLKLFKPWFRTIMVVTLEIMMLATISMTALLVNAIVWTVYLLVAKKIKISTVLVIVVVISLALSAYAYGLENQDTPILGSLAYRIDSKLDSLERNDFSSVTTGRVDLSEQNFEYFQSLPFVKRLFGGTSVNGSYVYDGLRGVSHNEYIDMLLNVGYIGAALLLFFVLMRVCSIWKAYRETKDDKYMCALINKIIWLVYGATLTVFLDYRFLFIYFI